MSTAWRAIRWKILIIFAFFNVVSTFLIGAFSIAMLNVVVRRESAYLVEERLSALVENQRFNPHLSGLVKGGSASSTVTPVINERRDIVWPASRTTLLLPYEKQIRKFRPSWLTDTLLTGMIADVEESKVAASNSGGSTSSQNLHHSSMVHSHGPPGFQ